MDTLTPSLDEQQIRENIDTLQKAGTSNDAIQKYVDNYQRSPDGTYSLKQSIDTRNAEQTLSPLGQMINQFNEGARQLATGIDTARSAPDIKIQDIQDAYRGGGIGAGLAEAGAQVAKGATHAVASVGNALGGAGAAVTAPLAPVFNVGTKIGEAIGNAVPDNFAMKGEDILRSNPSIGQNASDILGLSNLAIPKAVEKTAPVVSAVGSKVGQNVGALAGKTKSAVGSIGPSLESDVGRALGFTGKMNAPQALGKTSQSIRALGHIVENAPNIRVMDANGISIPFNPSKATFTETLDAWKQTRDSIYNRYTAEAAKSGDQGALFKANDFKSLISTLDSAKLDSTSAFKSKANSLKQDIIDNFSSIDNKTGKIKFSEVSLPRMQSFLEKINIDVNPASDKAAAQVSQRLSQGIRKIMDDKIENTTGAQYQTLRNKYADMKSIESDLVNQFKKAARGQGGTIAKYVEGFGTIDTVLAILRGSPTAVIGGLGTFGLGKIMEILKDPTRALQRSFKKIEGQNNVPSIQAKTALATKIPIATSKANIISNSVSPLNNNVKKK